MTMGGGDVGTGTGADGTITCPAQSRRNSGLLLVLLISVRRMVPLLLLARRSSTSSMTRNVCVTRQELHSAIRLTPLNSV